MKYWFMGFRKQKFIKVIITYSDKSIRTKYIHNNDYEKFLKDNGFLHNPNHTFISSDGYRTFFFNMLNGAENYNPLDFESKYDSQDFKTAIKNNIVKQTFETVEKKEMDLTFILTIVNIGLTAFVLYMLYQQGGGF